MDTRLSLMSIAHQKPREWQLSRDLLFQRGDGGDILPKCRLGAHAFCGGQMKMFQVILGLPLIRRSDGCSTTVISFPHWRLCPNIPSWLPLCAPRRESLRHKHYSCNCRTYMLVLCGDVCLYIILVLLCVARLLCVFQENFSTVCSTTLVVSVCVVCVACCGAILCIKERANTGKVGRNAQMSSGRHG